jgi:hypothetical protein
MLLRIANIIGMEFELQQVICNTLVSYVLIDPLHIVSICLMLSALESQQAGWMHAVECKGNVATPNAGQENEDSQDGVQMCNSKHMVEMG